MSSKHKNREGVIYSTQNDFDYYEPVVYSPNTLPPQKQSLRILLDKKKRAGKQVSLITGFVGKETDLEELAKKLKNQCGSGGSAKDGEIIIQGDHRQKIFTYLTKEGYKSKIIG